MVLFTTIGQIMFKRISNHFPNNLKDFKIYSLFKRDFIVAILMTLLAPVFYLLALRKIDLAVAYSFTSLNYIAVVFAGKYFLDEKVGVRKIFATLLIVLGIVFYLL
jgi:drug/metabolite transporter (DMT)-like permease